MNQFLSVILAVFSDYHTNTTFHCKSQYGQEQGILDEHSTSQHMRFLSLFSGFLSIYVISIKFINLPFVFQCPIIVPFDTSNSNTSSRRLFLVSFLTAPQETDRLSQKDIFYFARFPTPSTFGMLIFGSKNQHNRPCKWCVKKLPQTILRACSDKQQV